MDTKQSDKIAAFDTLYTTNRIQMLKILFPLVGKKDRHKLAIYIKYLEFQYTLALTKEGPFSFSLCAGNEEKTKIDLSELCDELSPFCSEKEKAMLNQFKNIQNTLKQYKEMEAAMSMMKELFPDANESGETGTGDGFFSPEMLMNLLSPEQQELFSMFQKKEE